MSGRNPDTDTPTRTNEQRTNRQRRANSRQAQQAREQARQQRQEAVRGQKRDAAKKLSEQTGRDISEEDIVIQDGKLRLKEQRQKEIATDAFANQLGRDIDVQDIQITDEGAQLAGETRREIAADQIDEEVGFADVNPGDIELTDRGAQLRADVREQIEAESRDQAVSELDQDVPSVEITEDDVVQEDGAFRLRESVRQEAAVSELDSEVQGVDITDEDVVEQGDSFRLTDDAQRDAAVSDIDNQVEEVDITGEDVVEEDDSFRLRESVEREVAAEQIEDELAAPSVDVQPDQLVEREVSEEEAADSEDLEPGDTTFELNEHVEREVAAAEINEDVTSLQVTASQVTQTGVTEEQAAESEDLEAGDETFTLTESAEREAAANEISMQIEGYEISSQSLRETKVTEEEAADSENLEAGDTTYELREQVEADIAAERINEEIEGAEITAGDLTTREVSPTEAEESENLDPGDETYTLEENVRRELAAEDLDQQYEGVDIDPDDLETTTISEAEARRRQGVEAGDETFTLDEANRRNVAAEQIDDELENYDISATDVVERPVSEEEAANNENLEAGDTTFDVRDDIQKELVAEQVDQQYNRFEVDAEDIEQKDSGEFGLTDEFRQQVRGYQMAQSVSDSVRQTAEQIDQQFEGTDIDAQDIAIEPGGEVSLDDDVQRSVIANQADREYGNVEVGPGDLERQGEDFVFDASVRQEIAAEQIDQQTAADIGADDVQLTEGGVQLDDQALQEITAQQLDERFSGARDVAEIQGPDGSTIAREAPAGRQQFQMWDADVTTEDLTVTEGGDVRLRDEFVREQQLDTVQRRLDASTETTIAEDDLVVEGGQIRLTEDAQREEIARQFEAETGADVDPADLEQQVTNPRALVRGSGVDREFVPTGESQLNIAEEQFRDLAEQGEIELFDIEVGPDSIAGAERRNGEIRPVFENAEFVEQLVEEDANVDWAALEDADYDINEYRTQPQVDESSRAPFINLPEGEYGRNNLEGTVAPGTTYGDVYDAGGSENLTQALKGGVDTVADLPGVEGYVLPAIRLSGRKTVGAGEAVAGAVTPITDPITSASSDAAKFARENVIEPYAEVQSNALFDNDISGLPSLPGGRTAADALEGATKGLGNEVVDITIGAPALIGGATDTAADLTVNAGETINEEGIIEGPSEIGKDVGQVSVRASRVAATTIRENPAKAIGTGVGAVAGGYLTGVAGSIGVAKASTKLSTSERYINFKGELRTGGQYIPATKTPLVDAQTANLIERGKKAFPGADRDTLYRNAPDVAIKQQARNRTPDVIAEQFRDAGFEGTILKKALDVEPDGPGRGRAARGYTANEWETGIDPEDISEVNVGDNLPAELRLYDYETPGSSVSSDFSPYFTNIQQTPDYDDLDIDISLKPGSPLVDASSSPTLVMVGTRVEASKATTAVEHAREMARREGDATAITRPPRSEILNVGEIEATIPAGADFVDVGTGRLRNIKRRLGIGSDFYTELAGRKIPIRTVAPEDALDSQSTSLRDTVRDFVKGERAQAGGQVRVPAVPRVARSFDDFDSRGSRSSRGSSSNTGRAGNPLPPTPSYDYDSSDDGGSYIVDDGFVSDPSGNIPPEPESPRPPEPPESYIPAVDQPSRSGLSASASDPVSPVASSPGSASGPGSTSFSASSSGTREPIDPDSYAGSLSESVGSSSTGSGLSESLSSPTSSPGSSVPGSSASSSGSSGSSGGGTTTPPTDGPGAPQLEPPTVGAGTLFVPGVGLGAGTAYNVNPVPDIPEPDDDFQIVNADAEGWGVERVRVLPDANQDFIPEEL
jgi:hypothetical protein